MVELTLPQRLEFEKNGFVVLEGVLREREIDRLKRVIYRAREDPARADKGVYAITKNRTHYFRMGNLAEYDPAFVDFATHPKIVPLAEDLLGGKARLEENETIVNSRDPSADTDQLRKHRPNATCLHRAVDPSWGTYYEQGRLHSLFVKAIAYLTDVGPDDGGTCFIAGSHRLLWPREDILRAAEEQRSLYRCVTATAGSVVLFTEACYHSSTEILSDRERVIVSSGYVAPMLRMERGNRIRPEFAATLPEEIRPLMTGSERWAWTRRYP